MRTEARENAEKLLREIGETVIEITGQMPVLYVREGDFVRYGDIYYEIVKLIEPRLLFGQPEHRFEIKAECIRARDGLFNAS